MSAMTRFFDKIMLLDLFAGLGITSMTVHCRNTGKTEAASSAIIRHTSSASATG